MTGETNHNSHSSLPLVLVAGGLSYRRREVASYHENSVSFAFLPVDILWTVELPQEYLPTVANGNLSRATYSITPAHCARNISNRTIGASASPIIVNCTSVRFTRDLARRSGSAVTEQSRPVFRGGAR